MTIVLRNVTTDIRQLSGLPEGYIPDAGSIWFQPLNAFHVEDGDDDFLVSTETLKKRLVDGIDMTPLPPTPIDNLMKVQLRGVKGYGEHWYVQIPDADCNLFDLPHIDPETLDPAADPQPAWVAEAEALAGDIDTNATAILELADVVDDKADTTALTDGLAAKADATATTAALAGKQPLAAMLTKLAALAATLTDTQMFRWDATLGEPVAVNATGLSLNGNAVNATAATTAISATSGLGTIVQIASTSISVTNSGGRPVVLVWDATFFQSVVGTGSVYLSLYETTAAATHRKSTIRNIPNSTAAGLSTLSIGANMLYLGAVTTTRTFELRAALYQASGSPSGTIANGVTTPTTLLGINL